VGLQPDNKVSDNHYHGKEGSQIPVTFEGNLARELGIQGTFDQEISDRLFRGMRPEMVDGKEQKLTLRLDKDRVGAWDWTFNVDKSISTAELVGGDSRILGVRQKAVTAAMDYVEENSRVRVRKGAEVDKPKPKTYKYPARYTDSLLYECHWHTSARDGSPHGHAHVKIYNLSKDPVEDAVKAVELRFVDRKEANGIYNNVLRKGLNELGYKTKSKGESLEIAGFPAEVKVIFSPRHEAIKEMEATFERKAADYRKEKEIGKGVSPEIAASIEAKPLSSKAKSKLSVYNRPEKPTDRPLPERQAGWRARLGPGQLKAVMSMVSRAKLSVKSAKWRSSLKRHASKLRSYSLLHSKPAHARTRDNERSR
jgi:conjugative relaxase-like TrwC/TraI family protein